MKPLLPYFLIGLLTLFGCSNQSETTILSQAEQKIQHASVAIHDNDLNAAEQSLLQGTELLASINNKQRLVETYTTLASVQLSLGKPMAALSSYTVVRNLYAQAADRNSEIPVMLEMGQLYFRLGMSGESIAIVEESLLMAQLYQFTKLHAEAELLLGTIHLNVGKPQRANSYFTQAGKEFLQLSDTARIVKSFLGKIHSLVKAKKTPEAKEIYNSLESILLKNPASDITSNAYVESGFAFMESGNREFAHALFRNALVVSNRSTSGKDAKTALRSHIGLGEVYYNAYAFSDAQKEFIAAYNLQKRSPDNGIDAYCLIRIADCNRMQYALNKPQEAAIRALQLYENAMNVFSRMHLGIGEAIALHRIGMLKELSGDDNAALTYYKRAVEKFIRNNIPLRYISSPVDFRSLMSDAKNPSTAADWFAGSVIDLLLKYHRTDEAMKYSILQYSFGLEDKISLDDVIFRQKEKQHAFDVYRTSKETADRLLLELYDASAAKNKTYADRLVLQLAQRDKDLPAQAIPPMPWYVNPQKIETTFLRLIDPSITLLQFHLTGAECWVSAVNSELGSSSIRVSSYGMELEKKMKRYIALCAAQKKDLTALQALSEELYSILLRPVEKLGRQRFVVIPIEGLEKFPFHTLMKNGRSLIEMIEVSYLPSPVMIGNGRAAPRSVGTISAFGFQPDSRWGLEFELRDIRSFFRDTQISLNQNATKENLEKAEGDLLQLSSPFRSTGDDDYFVTLSDGSISPAGTTIPISLFPSLHSFPIVYLSDVQSQKNNIDVAHSLYWFMNGASAVITTELPITPRAGKLFEENFYSSLSSNSPYQSYRSALLEFGDISSAASFFYYGF